MRKPNPLTAASLGIAWLLSIGAAFVMGVLSAFAFHLAPEAGPAHQANASLAERDLMITIERYSGQPADMAALKSVAAGDQLPQQLESTLRAVLRHHNTDERLMAAHRIANGLPHRKSMACIRFLGQLPPAPPRDQVWGVFLESWGHRDGRSAMGFAASLDRPREQQQAISAVLRGWTGQQPREAWAWVAEHAGNTRRAQQWFEIILANLGRNDRTVAFDLLRDLPDSPFRSDMATVVMDQLLAVHPPAEAANWLSELPPSTAPEAAAFLALRWSLSDPPAAAEFLLSSFPAQQEALAEVLREWVYRQPSTALNWAWDALPPTALRNLLPAMADEWIALAGPPPLAAWINQKGPDPALDQPIQQLALATAPLDPPTALSWAQSIQSVDLRSATEIQVAGQWIQQDPDSAAQNLPDLLQTAQARATLLPETEAPEE